MADYTNSRKTSRGTYPDRAIDAKEFSRIEPLITPKEIRDRVLFGIPLMSARPDPITKKNVIMTDALIADQIISAVNRAEADLGIDIFQVKRAEGHPFDRHVFRQQGFLKTQHAPISSVDSITIKPNDGVALYSIPVDWLSSAGFKNGQIFIAPILPATSANFVFSSGTSGAGAGLLAFLNQLAFTPNYFEIQYTSGFSEGCVPRIVNELIGCYVGIEVLSMLATTDTANSRSLSLDGGSQSVSNAGPERYKPRTDQLEAKRLALVGKLKSFFGRKVILGWL
jgi:hypothetical protein